MRVESVKYYLKHPQAFLMRVSGAGLLDWIPDKRYLLWYYRLIMKMRLNLKSPKTFTEKIQGLKLYNRTPLHTQISDKYAVREYIANRVGSEYTVPLLGVWNTFDEIDFDELPEQFVLKTTHDCGGNYICRDKRLLDISAAKDKIERHLRHNYYPYYREWAYKDIRPRIIAEEYLADESGYELKDYKFMCFNGHPKYVVVCKNRESQAHPAVDLFDMQWKPLENQIKYRDYQPSGCVFERPQSFEKMIEFCEILAKPFPFVRVDFSNIQGEDYIGELTLYPAGGYAAYGSNEMN